MNRRLLFLLTATAAALASPLRADLSVKPSFYPDSLEVSLDGRALLERLGLQIQPRGADLPLECRWHAATSSAGSSQSVRLPCRAAEIEAILRLEETAAGVLTITLELDRERPLAAEGGIRLTAAVAGFESGTAFVRSES